MQLLTCRVGESVWVGDHICVTLQRRLHSRVTVSVVAPADADLFFGDAVLMPSVLPSGTHSYFFSLQAVRCFRIGEIEFKVWLPGETVQTAAECLDHLHIGVTAPAWYEIRCDHAGHPSAFYEIAKGTGSASWPDQIPLLDLPWGRACSF